MQSNILEVIEKIRRKESEAVIMFETIFGL